ncbi:MAG: head GIN domain-containing protein [Saprospiraceae bacterium]|nr:head GIN domain-containing protein [Saprospiraceae bacterium]
MRNLLIFMFLVAVFVLGNRSYKGFHFGFGGVKGTGPVQNETRTANGFHALDLQISGEVEVRVGEKFSVEVSAQQNILPLLKTEVKDGALLIYWKDNINTAESIKIKVTAPAFDKLSVGGSGSIRVLNALQAEKMSMNISGSGEIYSLQSDFDQLAVGIDGSGTVELGGKANDLKADISGSGDVKAKGLTANTLKVIISGSGTVTVDVTNSLNASVSGSGEVFYSGSPKVESSVSGSGAVKKIEVQ